MAEPDTRDRVWTVLELLRWTTDHFASCGIDTPRLDAELLLAHALGSTRLKLYVEFEKPVMEAERSVFRELVRKRGRDRVPVSQLLGEKEFWSLSFRVTSDVLTPRPDTETAVQAALERLPDAGAGYRVLDVGTGSGAIALALAHERRNAHIVATDISQAALQIAAENAEQLQLSDRVRFLEGNAFEPVRGERFDLVISNPPYLRRSEWSEGPPELAFEPEAALAAGEDGLAVLRPLAEQAGSVVSPGGAIVLEIGPGQEGPVSGFLTEAGFEKIEVLRDLARRPRVVTGNWPAAGGAGNPEAPGGEQSHGE